MYSDELLQAFNENNRLRATEMKDEPAFYRNLEQTLDLRRQENYLIGLKPRWTERQADFTTCDLLSLSRTGQMREAFLKEIADHPEFILGAGGSRCLYGNYGYLNQVEQEIADFHGAETAYITHTGFLANQGVLSGVPQPGDAIVYDELMHASCHEGFQLSLAAHKVSFRHNDPDSLRDVLISLKSKQPAFRNGTRSILVVVESVYSMDGDVCPLLELVQLVKTEFPLGNAQFLVDEAHSVGVVGERGCGLVSMLGLQKEIAIRVHVASKSLSSCGGIILCNKTIRSIILNHARSIIFSAAPSFPMVASIRVGYRFLMSGQTMDAQERLQRNVKHFFKTLGSNPIWWDATDEKIAWIPLLDDWEQRDFQSHIIPCRVRHQYVMFLFYELILNNMSAFPMAYPVVPKGESRIRLEFHAHNTIEQIEALASVLCHWAQEMLDIENGESEHELPSAARKVFAMKAQQAALK